MGCGTLVYQSQVFLIYQNIFIFTFERFTDDEFIELSSQSNLSWIGEKCISNQNRKLPVKDKFSVSRWRRVMNLSISCCITSLIIISAALLLGIVGVFYKQAACILVDSVLFQLAVFFSVFGMALHFTNRLERRPELGSPCVHQSLCPGLVYSTGWAQYLGLGGVALCTATAVSLYGLHRLVITMVNTGQPFK